MIGRDKAWQIVTTSIANQNLRRHMQAAEACLSRLASRFSADAEEWGLTGLLHDIDLEIVNEDFSRHARYAVEEMLAQEDITPAMRKAILAHNNFAPHDDPLSLALWCVDPATGLVVAGALMCPDRKLKSLELKSLLKRFREKRFAAGASREQMDDCVGLGLTREEFLGEVLLAMQGIDVELGL